MKIGKQKVVSRESDTIIDELHKHRTAYINRLDLVPNTVYLGYKQFDCLLDERLHYASVLGGSDILGMTIFPVDKDDYIKVGLENRK